MGSLVHGWEGSLVGRWGWEAGFRARLLVRVPEAAPPAFSLTAPPRPPPQAEAAGNLEVVALLQSLQGGVGDQALGPVSPPTPCGVGPGGDCVLGTEPV